MVSKLDVTIFPNNNNIVLLIVSPVDDFESRVCRFSFPFGLFGLIVSNRTFFSTDHDSTINPAQGINHSNDFRVIKSDIDFLVSFHGHIVESDYELLAVVCVRTLNL